MASSSNSPCAACKFLRRKCTQGCVFAPYFPPDNPQKFSSVHRVFGASNVAKLLNELPSHQREDAVNSLAYEADSRLRDPVYGCVGYISILQGKLRQIQHELENAKKELSTYIGPAAYGPILPPYQSQFAVGGVPFHHQNQYHHPSVLSGSSSSSMNPFGGPGMGMGLGLTAANSQMLIREQQQAQQMAAEAQQLAVAAAAREQEMLRSLEQQQQYSGGFVNVSDGRAGYNQMAGGSISCVGNSVVVGGGGGGGGSSSLVIQPQQQFGNQFQVQQQQQQHQLLDLHQYSDQNDETAPGVGVGQHQIRAKSEEGGMTSAVDILKFN